MPEAPPGFPYFPLYVKDWLTGQSTTLMSPEEKGAFLDLLCHAWLADPPCTLPADDKALAKLSGLGSRWKKVGPALRGQFEVVAGRLRNGKQWDIWQDMMTHREKRANAGRKGNEARWGSQSESQSDRNRIAKPSPSLAPASALAGEVVSATANRLAAAANKGLAEHPERPQPIPRIIASSGRTHEATEILLAAEIPVEFAEAEIYRLARTHKADGQVSSLNYFVGGVARAWEQEGARASASNSKPQMRVVRGRGGVGQRSHDNALEALKDFPEGA